MHFIRNVCSTKLRQIIADTNKHYTSGKMLGLFGCTPSRGITTVGTTGNANTVRVRQANLHQMLFGIYDVVELFTCIIVLTELRKLNATTGTAAIVRIKGSETMLGSKPSWRGITVIPTITNVCFGSAMNGHNYRNALPFPIVVWVH